MRGSFRAEPLEFPRRLGGVPEPQPALDGLDVMTIREPQLFHAGWLYGAPPSSVKSKMAQTTAVPVAFWPKSPSLAAPMTDTVRIDGRRNDQLRPIRFQNHIAPHAAGSTLIEWGNTRVICAATVEESVPRWMKDQKVPGGWLSAEYSMLPYSTLDRKARDISKLKLDGRSQEIQRLIGRSLRAVVDLERLGARTLCIDCDVLQADGGTRTASITGAFVAVSLAIAKLQSAGLLNDNPITGSVAAVSMGVFNGVPLLDLNYPEDKDASVDMNLVMNDRGQFIELQAAGEEATFSDSELASLLALGRQGIQQLIAAQRQALITP